jgi:hypothetical protein
MILLSFANRTELERLIKFHARLEVKSVCFLLLIFGKFVLSAHPHLYHKSYRTALMVVRDNPTQREECNFKTSRKRPSQLRGWIEST